MKNKIIVLSIHKKYADLILSGKKTIELRKTPLPKHSKILLYETKGTGCGMIVGEMECHKSGSTYYSNGMKYWLKQAQVSESEWKEYYKNTRIIYGLFWHIKSYKRYDKPVPLSHYGIDRAPQSYCFVKGVNRDE